ncbi:MAG: MarR family winged helix-turn-helix transcriptional regulator [Sciscionella sp.]
MRRNHEAGVDFAVPRTGEDAVRLFLAVARLSRSLRRVGSQGLGHGSLSALATLANCGSMRLGDLAAREGVAPPTLSRMITVLVDSGFVRRTPDPQDGRASLVAATAEGERVVSGTRSDRMRELARRIDSLTVEQRIALAQALPALEALVLEDTQA